MNEVMRNEGSGIITEVIKSADIKITLEQWPCTVAILGVCVTCAFIAWVNKPLRNVKMA